MNGRPPARALGWLCALLMPVAAASGAISDGCTPSPRSIVFATQVPVTGRVPALIHAVLPRRTEVLVTARATGTDVSLERTGSEADAGERAENPNWRWGPRTLIFNTAEHTEIEFRVVGK